MPIEISPKAGFMITGGASFLLGFKLHFVWIVTVATVIVYYYHKRLTAYGF